jgi:glucose-6-phosphate isomerase
LFRQSEETIMDPAKLWERYKELLWRDDALGVSLDVSRMDFDDAFLRSIEPEMRKAFAAMRDLEAGAIANPDEGRMVGHYWLRAPEMAPKPEITREIEETVQRARAFADKVHAGTVKPPDAPRFSRFISVGIGGSALGPEFVSDALGSTADRLTPHFIDNTDPDGVDRVLAEIGDDLAETLTIVISKSGGTKETRNGMLEVEAAYRRLGLELGPHAVAVTGEGSALEKQAREEEFLEVFPMWDWVGGRTSELSAVGLVPAALQGIDVGAMLEGARDMDERTRVHELRGNPAALLAAAWYHAGSGKGEKQMVVLPYKDRLLLFSRYLQQLVMESLGKEKDLDGNVVHQGIAVFGNKGSTDQHAYVQQLRDGRSDFFVTFIEALKDRAGRSPALEQDATAGDFLLGFLMGTRSALYQKGRRSMVLTLPEVSPHAIGMLIALYERAVGLYASLIHINAYHQPGVEAGKKAAAGVLKLQARALAVLHDEKRKSWRLGDLARLLDAEDDIETLFKILEHAAANPDHGVVREKTGKPWESVYRAR